MEERDSLFLPSLVGGSKEKEKNYYMRSFPLDDGALVHVWRDQQGWRTDVKGKGRQTILSGELEGY